MEQTAEQVHVAERTSEVIAHAVRLYVRFALRLREVEELLVERGIVVSYETVRRRGLTPESRSAGAPVLTAGSAGHKLCL